MNDDLDRWHDAKLLHDALRRQPPDSTRHDFIQRLRRSFHQWGSLTEAMRAALTVSSSIA
jgi:hypothetical protein